MDLRRNLRQATKVGRSSGAGQVPADPVFNMLVAELGYLDRQALTPECKVSTLWISYPSWERDSQLVGKLVEIAGKALSTFQERHYWLSVIKPFVALEAVCW